MDKRLFKFSKHSCEWVGPTAKAKTVLGGKGAGLVEMCSHGMPVPPGFTLTTDNCNAYRKLGGDGLKKTFVDNLMVEVTMADADFGQFWTYAPLVSVRSGAPISMPGMMDTILNVGLTVDNLSDWADRIGKRAAMDSYRRLIQMLGATAFGVPHNAFEKVLADVKKIHGVTEDTDLTVENLAGLIGSYEDTFQQHAGFEFPQTREAQLRAAIIAVFDSWMNPRAIEYRKINKIDENMGTAVTVQAMVFGNMGDDSGSGVLFTRDPSTGEAKVMAEYLANAQGEDVVAGIRTPDKIEIDSPSLGVGAKHWMDELGDLCFKLEDLYADMVDVEFTVQKGELFILQSRTGKRSARAAFKIATDLVADGVISKQQALKRLTADQFKVVRRPTIDPKFKTPANLTGLPACPGVAVGKAVFSAQEAVESTEPCILVTHETTPDDIAGMNAAVGILTQTGGATSHAAVVARAMDKTCVVGCTGLNISALKAMKNPKITLDGSTGRVWIKIDVPVIDSSDAPEIKTVGLWALEAGMFGEAVPTDLEDATHDHVVMAAQWWGNVEAMEAVLEGIAVHPHKECVAIDLRGPADFTSDDDKALLGCFGALEEDTFALTLTKALKGMKAQLEGVTLLNVGQFADMLVGFKLNVTTDAYGECSTALAPSVPMDYAVFKVLAK